MRLPGIRKAAHLVTLLAGGALFSACEGAGERDEMTLRPAVGSGEVEVRELTELMEDDGQWVMAAKNYASTRFSGLDQITRDNVSQLELAWTFSTGTLRGHEAAPLVVGDRMYITTPFPNYLFALDLANGGEMLWRYDPDANPAAQGIACCDVVNRGAAYSDGRIFFNTLDAQTVAVDAETGEEIWKTKVGDINIGETMTMAPLVVKNRVLVGNSGGELGVRGWIKALDVESGEVVWTGWSTGPDAEVLIDHDFFEPFYDRYRGEDLGVHTWPPDQWQLGGGNVWGWISYDPELDLIYHGTGNAGVWNSSLRPGDNLWSAGIFARDPDDGRVRWAYQFTPHDEHDYDAVMENILVDMEYQGEFRRLLLRPERNGFFYVMDRATGEVLSAEPWGPLNWAHGMDDDFRPIINEEKSTGNRLARNVCPAAPGMKDWQPSSYSPRTGLLYIPQNLLCMDYEGVEANYIAGTPYVGANVVMYAADDTGDRGALTAWDPVRQEMVWQIRESFPAWSGTVATATDLVFYGTMDRWFRAVDAVTGDILWEFRTDSGIIGQPITYLGPDGRQYVAILSGVGGWAGISALGVLPGEDPTIGLGFPIAVTDLPLVTPQGGTLYVFALPQGSGGTP